MINWLSHVRYLISLMIFPLYAPHQVRKDTMAKIFPLILWWYFDRKIGEIGMAKQYRQWRIAWSTGQKRMWLNGWSLLLLKRCHCDFNKGNLRARQGRILKNGKEHRFGIQQFLLPLGRDQGIWKQKIICEDMHKECFWRRGCDQGILMEQTLSKETNEQY